MVRGVLQSSRRGGGLSQLEDEFEFEFEERGWNGLASGFPHPFAVREATSLLDVSGISFRSDEVYLELGDEAPPLCCC